jgi:hypothetical protein
MALFGHSVTSNPQNKVSSCFDVYILQPWTRYLPLVHWIDVSTRILEISSTKDNIDGDFTIADGVAIDGNSTLDPQNKVSS